MSLLTSPPASLVRLDGIRWETYESLLADRGERPIRLTYDRGGLEIMTLGDEHEHTRKLLGRMIEAMTLELCIPIRSGGSQTRKRRDLEKGMEPDECYWIQHEREVRGRPIDADTAPPPDLALEVDVASSSINRLGIHAALGIPEVWRWKDGRLDVHLLRRDRSYRVSPRSRGFPWLPMRGFAEHLSRAASMDETSLLRAFVVWVREVRRESQG